MHNAPLTIRADLIVRVLLHIPVQYQPTLSLAIDCCVYFSQPTVIIWQHAYRAPYSRVLSLVQIHRVFAVGQDVREHASWEVGCVCGLLALGGGRHIRLGLDEDVWIMRMFG